MEEIRMGRVVIVVEQEISAVTFGVQILCVSVWGVISVHVFKKQRNSIFRTNDGVCGTACDSGGIYRK